MGHYTQFADPLRAAIDPSVRPMAVTAGAAGGLPGPAREGSSAARAARRRRTR